mgnify:CR=1 FL=1
MKTVLDGILTKLSPFRVEYVRGCAIRDTTVNEIEQAIEAARRSEVVIVVVGGSSARDFKTSYKETGAAVAEEGSVSDMECGEGFDRASLSLLGRQQELLESLQKTGKPLIVVYIEGRPLEKNWASEYADALLTAYYPGQEGGNAIADVLFGDYNPSGRLPISVPRSVGQIPVYYNKKAPRNHDYVEVSSSPLYSFGYGMSYTTFEYSDLQVVQKSARCFEVSFKVKNTGKYDGAEVIQVYVRKVDDTEGPIKSLRAFRRVPLKAGETCVVSIDLLPTTFEFFDPTTNTMRIMPGKYEIMYGNSSDVPSGNKLSVTLR